MSKSDSEPTSDFPKTHAPAQSALHAAGYYKLEQLTHVTGKGTSETARHGAESDPYPARGARRTGMVVREVDPLNPDFKGATVEIFDIPLTLHRDFRWSPNPLSHKRGEGEKSRRRRVMKRGGVAPQPFDGEGRKVGRMQFISGRQSPQSRACGRGNGERFPRATNGEADVRRWSRLIMGWGSSKSSSVIVRVSAPGVRGFGARSA